MSKKKDKSPGAGEIAARSAAGIVPFLPAHVASRKLSKLLAKGAFGGPKMSLEQANEVAEAMKAKGQMTVSGAGQAFSRPGLAVLPAVSRSPVEVPVGAGAHEIGHAKGGIIQRLSRLARHGLFGKPDIPFTKYRGPFMSPLHLPLLVAAASPKKKDEKGLWATLKKHPALAATLMATPGLAGEAHASARGVLAARKALGTAQALKTVGPLSKALGFHALGYVPAIAAIYGVSKLRDYLQKEGGQVGSAVSRPLISIPDPGRIVREHDDMVPITTKHRPVQKQTPGRKGE